MQLSLWRIWINLASKTNKNNGLLGKTFWSMRLQHVEVFSVQKCLLQYYLSSIQNYILDKKGDLNALLCVFSHKRSVEHNIGFMTMAWIIFSKRTHITHHNTALFCYEAGRYWDKVYALCLARINIEFICFNWPIKIGISVNLVITYLSLHLWVLH